MKKITYILLILLLTITIVGCNNKKEEKNDKKEAPKIVKEEINEGEVEGYKFRVVDKETDRVKIQMENGDIMLIVLSKRMMLEVTMVTLSGLTSVTGR